MFAVNIIKFSEKLVNIEASWVLKKQILRSSTSIALNYAEAQNAQSKKEFIYRVSIAFKELRETKVNLEIIYISKLFLNEDQMSKLLKESGELTAIFTSILKTAKSNQINK